MNSINNIKRDTLTRLLKEAGYTVTRFSDSGYNKTRITGNGLSGTYITRVLSRTFTSLSLCMYQMFEEEEIANGWFIACSQVQYILVHEEDSNAVTIYDYQALYRAVATYKHRLRLYAVPHKVDGLPSTTYLNYQIHKQHLEPFVVAKINVSGNIVAEGLLL